MRHTIEINESTDVKKQKKQTTYAKRHVVFTEGVNYMIINAKINKYMNP